MYEIGEEVMKTKLILTALVIVLLLTAVASTNALTWYRAKVWGNQYVQYHRMYCVTLPVYTGYTSHRVSLKPLNYDVDLYLYGYNGSWVYLGGSAAGGLVQDRVIFSGITRSAYHTIIACGYGFSGNSYFRLIYDVGI
jgi:hypothetical protein